MKFHKLGDFEQHHSERKAENKDFKPEILPIPSKEKEVSVQEIKTTFPQTEKEEKEIRFSIKSEKKRTETDSLAVFIKDNRERLTERGKEIYGMAIDVSKELMGALYSPYFEKYYRIEYAVSKIYAEIKENPFFTGFASYITPANYLYSHNVNTAIISMSCASALNYPREKAMELGCAAFLHDIGVADMLDIIRQERRLSSEEMAVVREHSVRGVEYLDKITDLEYDKKKIFARMIMETHERYDGSGYPYGLKGEELDESSCLLAIADTYEALSHKRNWREAYEPPVAMKFFLDQLKGGFHPRALKGLISSLGMYPPNSLVKLSTGEIAMVVLTNKKNLTRPTVEIVLDSGFTEIGRSYLDLTEYPLTAIEGELLYEELASMNPDFYSAFEMKYFWLDWG
ncbi:MAG: hypothetical protein Fur0012_05260 [Elusimicrobiota bacterium]